MLRDLSPDDPLSDGFRCRVSDEIAEFLAAQEALMDEVGTPALLPVAASYAAGGKRLRPGYCYWAYVAVGGQEQDEDAVMQVASSLDLLHCSALVHDDVIDQSDTRRGLPAAHRRFAQLHAERGGRGTADEFGLASAILLGDLLLMWSAAMFDSSGAQHLELARPELAMMRAEVTAGQFLDVSAAFGVADSQDPLRVANKVLEYKSASYSMRRPALIGARLGGADERQVAALGSFGSHIGHAFQLRDDVLAVWGDEQVTGKPTGGDLREGKATVLVLTALRDGSDSERQAIGITFGRKDASPAQLAAAAEAIESSGARAACERLIDEHLRDGLAALDEAKLTRSGHDALVRLAELSVRRAF